MRLASATTLYAHPSLWAVRAVLLAAVLSFWSLGQDVLKDYDEATYAMVIEDTLASGNILSLRFEDELWFDKPPLYFWISMLAGELFGATPFAYRFFAAASAVISVGLISAIVFAQTSSYRAAALTGITLATTAGYIEAARQVRLDVPVTTAVLLACFAYVRGLTNPSWLNGVGIGVGLGIMLKSVVGLFAAPFIAVHSALSRDIRWIAHRWTALGAALGALMIIPWHAYQYVQHGSVFWEQYFGRHVYERYTDNILGGVASNDALLTFFLQAFFPWHIVACILLVVVWRSRERMVRESLPHLATTLAVLAVFTTSNTKIGYYLVPVFPFAAGFIGIAGASLYERARGASRQLLAVAFLGAVALGTINTIALCFNLVDPYRTSQAIAREEQRAGRAIAEARTDESVFVDDWGYRETLQYYGKFRYLRDVVERWDDEVRYFLITPRAETSDTESGRALIYDGSSLQVFRIAP